LGLARVMDRATTGPDGFPIAPGHALLAAHIALSEFLLAEDARELARTPPDDKAWKKRPKRFLIDTLQAILQRLNWLNAHDRELEKGHVTRLQLVRLLRVLYTVKLPCTEPDLRALLDLTAPLLETIAPYGPGEYVVEYLRRDDLTPALCTSLRGFKSSLRIEGSTGQAAMQSLLQTLHMLLWLDEWEPLDPARCWSESVRRDFRAMTGERRKRWRRLLKHLRGNAPRRIPDGWAREAAPLLADVGLEEFHAQFTTWWAPFRSDQPLPLSVAGSHVIKGLLWYASLTRDDEIRETALWLLDVKWKQKRHSEKSMIALEVFGITKEQLLARELIAPERRAGPSLLEKLLNAHVLSPIDRIVAAEDGDLVLVQGELHYYRLHRSTRRIERATDDAVIALDWHALPDSVRLHVGRECNSNEQLMLRANLLLHDSVFGRYFVVQAAPRSRAPR
jgi:hypothetical protein